MWASLLTANHYKLQNLARSTCCLSTNKNIPGGRVLGSTPGFKIFFKFSSSAVQYNVVQHCQPALNLALPVRCMNRREWERRRNKFEFFLFFAGTDPQKRFSPRTKKIQRISSRRRRRRRRRRSRGEGDDDDDNKDSDDSFRNLRHGLGSILDINLNSIHASIY